MAQRNLRVVEPKPAPRRRGRPPGPKTLKQAAEKSSRDLLVMMRDSILAKMDDGVPAHTLAPLSKRIMELDKEIRAIDAKARQDTHESSSGNVNGSWDATEI